MALGCSDDSGGSEEDEELSFEIEQPDDGATVADQTVTIQGIAPAGAEVRLERSFASDESIAADDSGSWEYVAELEEGENDFEFFLQDDDDVRASLTVTYSPSLAEESTEVAATEEPAEESTLPEQEEPTVAEEPTEPATVESEPVIPGIAAVDVYMNLENQGFDCEGPDPFGELLSWDCVLVDGTTEFSARIYGISSTAIQAISATVREEGEAPSSANAGEFFGFLATLAYDGAEPEQAREWVTQNIDSGGEITIGTVVFSVFPNASTGRTWEFQMLAEGATPFD